MTRWARLTGSVETVGLRPGGITSPICPEISSPSFWNLRARDGDFCSSSSSTWLSVLQTWSTPPPPPPPLLSIVCCAHKSVTSHKHCILRFYCIANNRCLFLHKTVLLVTQGKAEIFAFLFCFFFGLGLFCFRAKRLCFATTRWVLRTLVPCEHLRVFLPLWSLISTAAWASNSREISSLLPLRAAWCSGANLHTDTDYV